MFNNSYSASPGRRKGKKRILSYFFVALLAAAALVSGCSRGYSRYMKLPADPSFAPGLGWAVVTSAYALARKSPEKNSKDLSIVRRGTVFESTERKIDHEGQDTGGLWYRYKEGSIDGWIHSGDLSIFPSEGQARKAAESLQRE